MAAYVTVVALVFLVVGTATVSIFRAQVESQQLEAQSRMLESWTHGPTGKGSAMLGVPSAPEGYEWVVLASDGRVMKRSSNASWLGLPDAYAARHTPRDGRVFPMTVVGPKDGPRLVLSANMVLSRRPVVVQVAQMSGASGGTVREFVIALIAVELVGFLLACIGGYLVPGWVVLRATSRSRIGGGRSRGREH